MPRRIAYGPGTPCWIDHSTVDLTGAKQFYATLFGWEFTRENDHGYHLIRLAGEIIGGLGKSPMDSGFGSSWNVYLAAKDLDQTQAEVRRLGGRIVLDPVSVGPNGRLCLAIDPVGAAVGFWEGAHDEGMVLADEPGALSGCELWTTQRDLAEEFYEGLFGDAATDLTICSSSRTCWLPFLGSRGREAVEEAALSAGARLLEPGILADPWGAVFGLTEN
jgi:predicted enzyme related to lactoylglutathione lyase